MADINEGLPVRTEGDVNRKVQVKVVDATNPDTQQLEVDATGKVGVKLSDEAGNGVTSQANGSQQALDVGINVLGVQIDPRATRALTSADVVTVDQPTHDNLNANVNLQVADTDVSNANPVPVSDGGGSLTVDAIDFDIRDLAFATDKVDVSGSVIALDAPTLAALESVTVQNPGGAGAVNIQDGGNSITVDSTNLDIRDLVPSRDTVRVGDGTDVLEINNDGSLNVRVLDGTPGVDVADYNTVASLAGGASSSHTYTSTGDFYLTQVEATSSGRIKIEIRVAGVTKFVMFNTEAVPNISLELKNPILVPTGSTVVVIRTNRANQAADAYSTVVGYTV